MTNSSPDEIPNRRDLLTGKAIARMVQSASTLGAAEDDSRAPADRRSSYLMEISREAMASDFQVLLNADAVEPRVESAMRALDCVEAWEQRLSVFREGSDISRINRLAAERAVQVDQALFGLLSLCRDIHRETMGAFDITASPLWRLWGFHRRHGAFPGADEIAMVRPLVDGQQVVLDCEESTVKFSRPGIELNMGAIGKGFALDESANLLLADGLDDFLIHGGQSSVLARGHRSAGDPSGWRIGIQHPLRVDRRVAEIRLVNRSLGTSGSAHQYFYYQGRRLSHVIDPRTGWPAEQVLGATAIADTAALADALSTAFFVLGPEETLAYCRQHTSVGAILILQGDRAGDLKFATANISDSDWHPL